MYCWVCFSECVCVHLLPSDSPHPPSANFTSSAAYREGTHTLWCPGESWQDVLYLIYHLPFMLPWPSSIVTINTASCASIINAARRPNLPWPPNIADSSSPINFKTPTAAYCWCKPTHTNTRIWCECTHADTHCCPWQVHWWRRRQAERQKSARRPEITHRILMTDQLLFEQDCDASWKQRAVALWRWTESAFLIFFFFLIQCINKLRFNNTVI